MGTHKTRIKKLEKRYNPDPSEAYTNFVVGVYKSMVKRDEKNEVRFLIRGNLEKDFGSEFVEMLDREIGLDT